MRRITLTGGRGRGVRNNTNRPDPLLGGGGHANRDVMS